MIESLGFPFRDLLQGFSITELRETFTFEELVQGLPGDQLAPHLSIPELQKIGVRHFRLQDVKSRFTAQQLRDYGFPERDFGPAGVTYPLTESEIQARAEVQRQLAERQKAVPEKTWRQKADENAAWQAQQKARRRIIAHRGGIQQSWR